MSQDIAIARAIDNRLLTRSMQMLTGIITGVVADGTLHDSEVQLLRTWISSQPEVATAWPGSAIAHCLNEVMSDGIITADERAYLLDTLQRLVGTDFAETGSASAEVAALPFDDDAPITLSECRVCLTGEFLYGTRNACEKVTEKAGGIPVANVSKKVAYLIVGTHVSPEWVNTSYGTKIMRAMELKDEGHTIAIIREQRWLDALRAQ